jgi:glutamate/tyrosine decarboxylase-like PLP-dependent enzyme
VSPTIAGSRPGSLVAGAWAAMMSLGEEGFLIDISLSQASGIRVCQRLKWLILYASAVPQVTYKTQVR